MEEDKSKRESEAVDLDLVMVLSDTIKVVRDLSRRLIIALIVSIICNIAMVWAFVWYESQFEYVDEVTTAETLNLEASGENAIINSIDGNQYNDRAVHNEGVGGR